MCPTVPQRNMHDFFVAHHSSDHVDGIEAAHSGTNHEFTGFSEGAAGMGVR